MDDRLFMELALKEAASAAVGEEIPVGAVAVRDGRVIAAAYNSNRGENKATRHAEINAIERAAEALGCERLTDCVLYVTKEPCAMCAGAIVHARIKRLVIGTKDIKYGACGTVLSVCGNPLLNHRPEIVFGVLEAECAEILKDFFLKKRNEKRTKQAIS